MSQTEGRGLWGALALEAQRRCPFAGMATAGLEMPVTSMVSKRETSHLPSRRQAGFKERE